MEEEHEHHHGHEHHHEEFRIFVNGQEKKVHHRKLIFAQIVDLAFPGTLPSEDTIFTVTYRKAEHDKKGVLIAGESVEIKNGTIFDVTKTNKS